MEYFGFEGKYNPSIRSKIFQSQDYWGATNINTGKISYGNLAFEDFATLRGTFLKELYTSNKIINGISLEKIPSDLQGYGMDTYLEEIHGYTHAFKQQGLFVGHKFPFKGVELYQANLKMFNVSFPTYSKKLNWIYKIPRRW